MNISQQLDFSQLHSGLRIFVKLTGMKADPLEHKWIRDEFDVVDAMSTIPYFVKESKRMMNKRMYAGKEYSFIDDVTKDVEEVLIVAKEAKETALNKKKNLMMYHLVVTPVLDILSKLPHQSAIDVVDEVVNHSIDIVMTHDITTTYEDALIAKMQVQKMITARTEAAKLAKNKRKPKKSIELDIPPPSSDD